MNGINGIHGAMGNTPVDPVGSVAGAEGAREPLAINDVVEISTAARLAALVHEIPDVRADLVAQIRSQIQAGAYETPERIEATVDRLMDEMLGAL